MVLKDSDSFNRAWPMARIVKVHPGKDGLVRVVDIKTTQGIYTRPVHKLVLLLPEVEDRSPQEVTSTDAPSSGGGYSGPL